MAGVDTSLFPLFSMEVENQCADLSAGMLKIEMQPDDVDTLDGMMRAAHAMKGAARVVGLDCAVAMAHSMEDYFTAAGQHHIQVASADVDVMLRAVDMLQAMASIDVAAVDVWLAEHAANVEAFAADIARMSLGQAVSPPEVIEPTDTLAEKQPQGEPQGGGAELRLSRQVLDTMMSLAGEAQLVSRQMTPVRQRLLSVRSHIFDADVLLTRMQSAAQDVFSGDMTAYQQQMLRMKNMQENLNQCFRGISDECAELEVQQRQASSISGRLYDHLVESRMQSFAGILPGLRRTCRDIARKLGKQVNFEVRGEDTLIDRDIAEYMQAPLQHLIRNSLDHGIENAADRLAQGKPEKATIILEARHFGGMLMLTVSDDGAGIAYEGLKQRIISKGMSTDALIADMTEDEILEFLFLPRFSMRDEVSEVSGRGAGLDLVATTIRKLRGRIQVQNKLGEGMCFEIRLPLTLSVLPALLVEIKTQLYALPLARVERVEHCHSDDIQSAEGQQFIRYKGKNVGLMQAAQVFGLDDAEASDQHEVVILGEHQHYGFVVDRILCEDNILEKPLDERFGKIENVTGGSVMADGRVALILDVDDVLHEMQKLANSGHVRRVESQLADGSDAKRVLVVDDSMTVREAERRLLSNHGYQVSVAHDGMDGWNALRADDYDLLVSDIDMPRMNGIELVRMVRADNKMNQLPVIVVSYKDSDEDRMLGLEAGANVYLTKSSFHDDSFIQSVRDLIGEVV